MSSFLKRLPLIVASVCMMSCGDDANSRDDGESDAAQGSPRAPDAGRADAGENDGREDDRDASSTERDARGPASERDASENNGDSQADAARSRPDPTMVTKGSTQVNGALVDDPLRLEFVSGFAYFDPTSNLSSGRPAMKIVLTTWPVDSCDPESVYKDEAKPGRGYVYCAVESLMPTTAAPMRVYSGQMNSWSPDGNLGCIVDLTKGELEGGSQVEGRMGISPAWGGPAISEVTFRLNHCGIIDPVNSNI